ERALGVPRRVPPWAADPRSGWKGAPSRPPDDMPDPYDAPMDSTRPEGDRRVSDGERALAIGRLRRSYAAGYLSLDTFAERMDQALVAKTLDDLRALLHDLPSMASIQDRIRRALRRFRLPPPALPLALPEEVEGE